MPTREDFEMALAVAQEVFQKQDPVKQAVRAGASRSPSGKTGKEAGHAVVPFLGTPYEIHGPGGKVCYQGEEEKEPALWEKILLLHYYNTSRGVAISQQFLSFHEIPDGRLYLPNFEKRAVAPLLGRFGNEPEEAWEPARKLGGRKAEPGDFSVTIPVFSRVPITLVFWKKDEEFPARLNILFDKTVVSYLPIEAIVLSTQMMAFRLIGLAGKPSK